MLGCESVLDASRVTDISTIRNEVIMRIVRKGSFPRDDETYYIPTWTRLGRVVGLSWFDSKQSSL